LEQSTTRPSQPGLEVAQAAGLIALGNIASRVLGLAREMVKSGLFGAGPNVDALNVAFRLPNTLYELLVGGMVSSALVPVLSGYSSRERRAELYRLLSILLGAVCVVSSLLLLAGELLAPQLIWLSAAGLSLGDQEFAAGLLRLMLPGVVLLSVASILTGALFALKRFVLPAFTGVAFNAAIVLVALVMGRQWGVRSMAAGMLVGAASQVVLQLPALRDLPLRLRLTLRHPALGRIARLYLPILLGIGVDNLLTVLPSYNLASRIGQSSISWMEYAATMVQVPLGLVVTAVSLAILPTLSSQASDERRDAFQRTLAQGLRLVLALIIPATIGLYVLDEPIIDLLLEHGVFTAADTSAVASALHSALLGMVFYAIDQPLIYAFYARKDTLTPALVGVCSSAFYAAVAFSLHRLGILDLPLLVMVNSLKLTIHALAMLLLARRRLGGLGDHGLWSLSLRAGVASIVMAGAAWGAKAAVLPIVPDSLSGEVIVVAVSGVAGLVVYILLALALGIEEILLLRAAAAHAVQRLTAPRR
jgi:putative peptidoglycan lipid II flippase